MRVDYSQYNERLFFSAGLTDALRSALDEYPYNILSNMVYRPDDENYFHMDKMNFLDWTDDNLISYLPYARIQAVLDDGGDVWTDKRRQSVRPGRVLRTIYVDGDSVFDVTYERIVAALSGIAMLKKYTIHIVAGSEIRDWYDGSSYDSSTKGNSLGNSCMRYHHCGEYLSLYTDNPDYVRMAILVDPVTGLLFGRALLWNTKEVGWVMDRIYGSDAVITQFKAWAKQKGMWHKEVQTYDSSKRWVKPNGRLIRKGLSVTFGDTKNLIYERYPYLDTFDKLHFTESGIGRLTSTRRNKANEVKCYDLRSTSGYPHVRTCSVCSYIVTTRYSNLCDSCMAQTYVCNGCGGTVQTHAESSEAVAQGYCSVCYRNRQCQSCNQFSTSGAAYPTRYVRGRGYIRQCETCVAQAPTPVCEYCAIDGASLTEVLVTNGACTEITGSYYLNVCLQCEVDRTCNVCGHVYHDPGVIWIPTSRGQRICNLCL